VGQVSYLDRCKETNNLGSELDEIVFHKPWNVVEAVYGRNNYNIWKRQLRGLKFSAITPPFI